MAGWGADDWLGILALGLALGTFAYHLMRVIRHAEPARGLISEGLHDLSILILGIALLVPRDDRLRHVLLGLCLVTFGAYVIRRATARSDNNTSAHALR